MIDRHWETSWHAWQLAFYARQSGARQTNLSVEVISYLTPKPSTTTGPKQFEKIHIYTKMYFAGCANEWKRKHRFTANKDWDPAIMAISHEFRAHVNFFLKNPEQSHSATISESKQADPPAGWEIVPILTCSRQGLL